jgi:hypothetical protein
MKKKGQQKHSTVSMIAIEPASADSPLTAFLSLFAQDKCVEAEAYCRRKVVQGLKRAKLNNRHAN